MAGAAAGVSLEWGDAIRCFEPDVGRASGSVAVTEDDRLFLVGGFPKDKAMCSSLASAYLSLRSFDWHEIDTHNVEQCNLVGAPSVSTHGKTLLFGGEEAEVGGCNDVVVVIAEETGSMVSRRVTKPAPAEAPEGEATPPPTPWPCARAWHTAVLVPGVPVEGGEEEAKEPSPRMIIFGGRDADGNLLNDVWSLDTGSMEWTEVTTSGSAPVARMYHCAAYDSSTNKVVVFGGSDGASRLRDTFTLNLEGFAWEAVKGAEGAAPSARVWASAASVRVPASTVSVAGEEDEAKEFAGLVVERVVVWGGLEDEGVAFPDLHVLDVSTGVWGVLAASRSPPARFGAKLLAQPVSTRAPAPPGGGEEGEGKEEGKADADGMRSVTVDSIVVVGGCDGHTWYGAANVLSTDVWATSKSEAKVEEAAPGMLGFGVCEYANGDKYEGRWLAHQRSGEGRCTYADGTLYDGNWALDKRHGKGTCSFPNGDTYTGDWSEDVLTGEGTMTYGPTPPNGETKYEGMWVRGQRHGLGKATYANGDVYEGKWRNGTRCGHGVLTGANGYRYEGAWDRGLQDGQGSEKTAGGDVYRGFFKAGFRDGVGTCEYTDGSVYRGSWNKGVRNGKGNQDYANRDRYQGKWVGDKRCGRGVCVYAGGSRYEGNWRNNGREGHGECTYSNGDVYVGAWAKDTRSGRGQLTFANGDVYEGEWENDKQHGRGTCKYNIVTSKGDEYSSASHTSTKPVRYDGQWKFGGRHGSGTCKYLNGDVYVGNWAKDRRSGKGKLTFRNGDVYDGNWTNDDRSGLGNLTVANATPDSGTVDGLKSYRGEWANGEPEGTGTAKYTNGDEYKGSWRAGTRFGRGVLNGGNGDVYDGEWANDMRNGRGTCTFASGDKYTGEWTDNRRHVRDDNWKGLPESSTSGGGGGGGGGGDDAGEAKEESADGKSDE